MEFIFIALKSIGKNNYNRLVLKNDKLVINKREFLIDEISRIEAEITEHIRVIEYLGRNITEKTYPSGIIKFKLKNGDEVEVETLNPLTKLEELVLKLNIIYDRLGKPKLYVSESSTYKNVYSRE